LAETDITGTTVRNWELRLRAAQLAGFRDFERQSYAQLTRPHPYERGVRVLAHRMRCDATNAVGSRKFHALELATSFIGQPVPDVEVGRCNDAWKTRVLPGIENQREFAELQRVEGTGTGAGMLGMLEAQTKTLRLPLWTLPLEKACQTLAVLDGDNHDGDNHDGDNHDGDRSMEVVVPAPPPRRERREDGDIDIEHFMAVSDHGSDISSARNMLAREIEGFDTKLNWDGDCLAHQYHLITGALLRAIEKYLLVAFEADIPTYYGHLAALGHILRDNAAQLVHAFRKGYPELVQESRPGAFIY